MLCGVSRMFVFCKQKTAYERRISDWSSDVCSSDLMLACRLARRSMRGPRGSAQAAGLLRPERPGDMRQRRLGGVELLGRHLGEILHIGRASCRERVCQYV